MSGRSTCKASGEGVTNKQPSTRAHKRQVTLGASAAWLVPIWVVALVALAFFLRSTRELFVPIVLALLCACALAPVVSWLEARRLPRALAASLVVLLLAATAAWGVWAVSDDFQRAAERLPAQLREVRNRIETDGDGGTIGRIKEALQQAQAMTEVVDQDTPTRAGGTSAPAAGQTMPTAMSDYLWLGSLGLIGVAGNLTVVFFLVYFLLLGAPAWRERLIRLSGDVASSRRAGAEVVDEILWQIQRFLVVRAVTGAAIGAALYVALRLLGAPAPGLWSLAAAVLNAVPYLGAVVVVAGLAVVGLFAGGVTMAWQLAGVMLILSTLEGWVLTPILLGKAARMNTLTVFLACSPGPGSGVSGERSWPCPCCRSSRPSPITSKHSGRYRNSWSSGG